MAFISCILCSIIASIFPYEMTVLVALCYVPNWAISDNKTGGLRTWNFQGLIKKEMEFLRLIMKKPCCISRGLGFWGFDISKGCKQKYTQFPEFKL